MASELAFEQHYDGRPMRCFAQRPANLDAMFRSTVETMPQRIALVFDGARITYGELAQRIDAEGWVRIFDRKKDMINRDGYKIYCSEVESTLSRHDGVVECAIVGRPDSVLGERVHAFVVRKTEAISSEILRAHCAAHLSDYKIPETIDFIETLPRNANGKVVKPQLRELLLASNINR